MISSHYLAINNSDLKSANALKQNGTKEMELNVLNTTVFQSQC